MRAKLIPMLFMVIERFREGGSQAVGERFQRSGRMLPDDVAYVSSWMDTNGSRCFQVMEGPNEGSLELWISRWKDLVNFEVVPVLPSAEFWQNSKSGSPSQS